MKESIEPFSSEEPTPDSIMKNLIPFDFYLKARASPRISHLEISFLVLRRSRFLCEFIDDDLV